MLRKLVLLVALVGLTGNVACGGSTSAPPSSGGNTNPPAACSGNNTPSPDPSTTGIWTLVWNDEFEGTNGSLPDSTKWVMETGAGGWGNNELEYYTNRTDNVQQQDGNLVITAKKESFSGSPYTSARLKTFGKFEQAYGKFEARIKMPAGQGIWPAFWMLGKDINTVCWPGCGEIDIMENIGREPSMVHGTIHGPGYSGANGIGAAYTLPSGNFSDNFHVFAIEWELNTIRFYVDDQLYATQTNASIPSGTKWVYNHPFFILLNVAVGGNWPGNPDSSFTSTQMLVDYVRVYAKQ